MGHRVVFGGQRWFHVPASLSHSSLTSERRFKVCAARDQRACSTVGLYLITTIPRNPDGVAKLSRADGNAKLNRDQPEYLNPSISTVEKWWPLGAALNTTTSLQLIQSSGSKPPAAAA